MPKEPKSGLIDFEYSFVWFKGSESGRRDKSLQCFHKIVGCVEFCLALYESRQWTKYLIDVLVGMSGLEAIKLSSPDPSSQA